MQNHNPLYLLETKALSEPDVLIAGGGPSGLACAIAAAQQGLIAEVVDGMAPPIDKACGEGLMPDTLEALGLLGVDEAALSAVESYPFQGIRFIGIDRSGHRVTTQANFPAGHGRGMRRVLLHQLLLDRAVSLGVRFSWKTIVQGIEPGKGRERCTVRTNRHTIHPRFIVGADGHQSRIRAWAGLDRGSISARRIGLRQHFAIAPWSDSVEVYWSDHGQAYVTPVASREICVAFVSDRKSPSVNHSLAHFPELQHCLAVSPATNSPRGSITLSRTLRRVTRNNIALIGDASGSVDAITGEGLGLCFRQALLLAKALSIEDLAVYQKTHLELQRLPQFMGRSMLLLDSSPRLRHRALSALERRPQFFQQMLRVHVGQAPIRIFGSTGLLASALCILAG